MLKATCTKLDAWTWIQDHDKTSNGRKAWHSLINHNDGTGELSKRIERFKEEISRLHYKEEKAFPFERYVTRLKDNFFILAKDKDENVTHKQRVDVLMKGIKSTDPSIVAAKTDIYKDYRSNFNAATSFLSRLISNLHSGAQLDYANRQGKRTRYVSALDYNDGRGGRGRACRGGGRNGQQSGRGCRDRGREGRGKNKVRINNIDSSGPHRNFTSDEWDRLGAARSVVIHLRNSSSGRGNRDGRGNNSGRGNQDNQRNASSTSTASVTDAQETTNQAGDQSDVSAITERGSQNGRSFGRGACS
jgi:hypothetical protein